MKGMEQDVMVPPPRTMLEIFERLPEGTQVQLIENNLVMSPSPKDLHQEILEELTFQLTTHVRRKNLGKVRFAPYDVYLDQKNVFQPDLIFIATKNLYKIQENGLHGAPDFIVEVLSPATAKYDRNEKKAVYQRCGVPEYWIVDPATKQATGYLLQEGVFVESASGVGVLASKVLATTLSF